MQSHLVAGGVHLMRDWTRCTQTELDVDLPPTVRELVAEDLGSLEPPGDATHEEGQIRWSQPQGLIELRIRQFGASPLDRAVQAVSNGTGTLLFEMTAFKLDRVPGPPPNLWLDEADFTRTCRPLDSTWSPSLREGKPGHL